MAFGVMANIFERKGNYETALSVLDDASMRFPFYKSIVRQKSSLLERISSLLVETTEKPEIIAEETASDSIAVVPDEQTQKAVEFNFLKFVQNIESDDVHTPELRASNLKLIPGIEFTPLYVKSGKKISFTHIKPINGLPQFSFEYRDEPTHETAPVETRKLPKVKSEEHHKKPEPELHIITETIAKILVQQGAYDAAIKAYTALSKENPEKSVYFNKKIDDLTSKK